MPWIAPMKVLLLAVVMAVSFAPHFSDAFSCHTQRHPSRFFGIGRMPALFYSSNNDGFSYDDPDDKRLSAQEQQVRQRFATGEGLKNLRASLVILRENLKSTKTKTIDDIRDKYDIQADIEKTEDQDPELVYAKAQRLLNDADLNDNDRKKWTKEAALARSCLARFNLDGLWIGNYGSHGYELINVTYSGDTLIATKVTGDDHVPRGERTFEVDLSPGHGTDVLLDATQKDKWGVDELHRYPGQGYVAKEGFVAPSTVEGQLVMLDKQFSFVWVKQRFQIIFGRPNDGITMRMMRDILSKEDEDENMKLHLDRCFQLEEPSRQENNETEPFRRIRTLDELGQNDEEVMELESPTDDLWKWKNCVDDVFHEDKNEA